jgi:hypothetical protein
MTYSDEQSSLLRYRISYECEKSYGTGPSCNMKREDFVDKHRLILMARLHERLGWFSQKGLR